MAGFFWPYGLNGNDFSNQEFLVFDDKTKVKTQEYRKNWAGPGGSWNIGYVRSPGDMIEGEGLEDLFKIIRESGEVKACLVKRMSEYFVGEKLTFDPGYIASLTGLFKSSPSGNEGFRAVLKRLLLDNTFSIDDPSPDRCYDFPAGAPPNDRPPCRVASVLEKNCVACHKSVSVNGGIDLSRWVETGKGRSFPHLSKLS